MRHIANILSTLGLRSSGRVAVWAGLGLYIRRGLVEQHSGRIWAESTPGRGSSARSGADPAASA